MLSNFNYFTLKGSDCDGSPGVFTKISYHDDWIDSRIHYLPSLEYSGAPRLPDYGFSNTNPQSPYDVIYRPSLTPSTTQRPSRYNPNYRPNLAPSYSQPCQGNQGTNLPRIEDYDG